MQTKYHWHIAAGVALIGASAMAVTPSAASLRNVHVLEIQLTAGDDATDIVIDIVRHGERQPPFNELLVGSPPYPAAPLSDLGQQQANDVGQQLFDKFGPQVSGIFSGQGLRDTHTAAPFADLEGTNGTPADVQILPGLDEIGGGIYSHDPLTSLGGALYSATMGAWAFGLEFVPLPGNNYTNGVAFNESFTGAIHTMYQHAMDNPVLSDNGEITAVGFNNESSIIVWALTHVKNPDLSFIVQRGIDMVTASHPNEHAFLPNAGVVEIKGNPTDGWTLVSWDGNPVPQHPGLLTDLFVDFRDLIIPPQEALWHIWEAIANGEPVMPAIQTGLDNVGETLVQFPGAVINDITGDFSELATATTPDDVLAALI